MQEQQKIIYKDITAILLLTNNKRISIKVDHLLSVIIKLPYGSKIQHGIEFLKKNYEWVKRAIKKQEERNVYIYKYQTGEKFYLFGDKLTLKCIIGNKNKIMVCEKEVILIHKNLDTLSREKLINKFYKIELLKYAKKRVHVICKQNNIEIPMVNVRIAISIWGSCNSHLQKINLNLKLAKFSHDVIDSVIYHELAHLKIPNHSREFYAVLYSMCKNYKSLTKQLDILK